MYIKNDNEASRAIYAADIMGETYPPPGVEFSSNGIANVEREVGEAMCDRYDSVHPHDTTENESEESGADADNDS